MIFEIDGSIIGFSFATLQGFGKIPCEIEKLQSAEMGFTNMSVPSFNNLPEILSTPAAFQKCCSSKNHLKS